MKLFVFGSSITSLYWNGAGTYYRGMYKNLHKLGYEITFAEPDAYGRLQKRDLEHVEYANVRVYESPRDIDSLLSEAANADLVIKHSGVGVDDERLEREILNCRSENTRVAFWDVDAPATLARVHNDPGDPFRGCIPEYDFIFTYGGGEPVVERYKAFGAKNCYPIYNALDPDTHHPVAPDPTYYCDLAFVGHRLPDREKRVEEFFFEAARRAPEKSFLLGGEGWGGYDLPKNVRWIGHVGSGDHNRINCSAALVLNVTRESMAEVGFSPPTRVFEGAGAGVCLITDAWRGIERFFRPGDEILVADCAEDVVRFVREVTNTRAAEIGSAMRLHALRDHTYHLRARQFDKILKSITGVLGRWPVTTDPKVNCDGEPLLQPGA